MRETRTTCGLLLYGCIELSVMFSKIHHVEMDIKLIQLTRCGGCCTMCYIGWIVAAAAPWPAPATPLWHKE